MAAKTKRTVKTPLRPDPMALLLSVPCTTMSDPDCRVLCSDKRARMPMKDWCTSCLAAAALSERGTTTGSSRHYATFKEYTEELTLPQLTAFLRAAGELAVKDGAGCMIGEYARTAASKLTYVLAEQFAQRVNRVLPKL